MYVNVCLYLCCMSVYSSLYYHVACLFVLYSMSVYKIHNNWSQNSLYKCSECESSSLICDCLQLPMSARSRDLRELIKQDILSMMDSNACVGYESSEVCFSV